MIVKLLPFIIAVGMLLDVISCILFVNRNKNGRGPSGQSLVTLILFYWLPILIIGRPLFTASLWLDGLILLAFHLLMVFIIPMLHKKLTAPTT